MTSIPRPFPSSNYDLNHNITQKYLNFRNGFFIEAGAADGFHQSNTWNLEKYKGWKGILVEPNYDAFNQCVYHRPNSKVYNCALVDNDFKDTELEIYQREVFDGDPGLMSTASFSPLNNEQDWIKHGVKNKFNIKARTLDSILDENNIRFIDYLSLDVEGLEYNILKGFNIEKYLPKVVSIECHLDSEKIMDYMSKTHDLVEIIGTFDYVFLLKYYSFGLARDIVENETNNN